ncbi:hypothetical protein [uncultured Parabacteroides sp.]|uniref:hypothetical protein n=1 Tax=uncultured Parabacteroides sp. TaxID=512312 RepID=UPI00261B98F6|nr:hypothetical protein [uncultured Parabacteroides sp.]
MAATETSGTTAHIISVPCRGNVRFLGRKLAFPRQETPVPLAGNARFFREETVTVCLLVE